jgi:hypothetical protein
MKKFIKTPKKLKEMKKLIYALVLLAGCQFVQAQEIIGAFFIQNQASLIPLDQITLTISPNIADDAIINLPIALVAKNSGTQPLTVNDTLFIQTIFNGSTPKETPFFNGEIKINDSAFLSYAYPIPVKDIKSGEYANRICTEVIRVSYNGVPKTITQTPYCADMTMSKNTDIAELDAFKDVKLYPNPVQDNNLKIENLSETTEIYLYNMTGQLIYKESAVIGNTMINVNNLSNGMYILKMQSGKSVRTEKIQVIR